MKQARKRGMVCSLALLSVLGTATVMAADKVVVVPLGGAVGDAIPGDVLQGKTFSSKAGKGLTGTLIAGITVETDPTVKASVKDGVSWGELSSIPAGFADGTDNGITAETDPTVNASVKDGVSWSEVSGKPAGFADGVDNDSGGDITGVTAGTGLTGGGTTGTVTLSAAVPFVLSGAADWAGVISGSNSSNNGYGVYGYATGAHGLGVYGNASNIGDGANFGGYFTAAGTAGHGVYGYATYVGDAENYGGYFIAAGRLGHGVHGQTSGTSGVGVYGNSSNSGSVTNYGGYFTAAGASGHGVHGEASKSGSVTNYGGYFTAAGASGHGVHGYAAGTNGRGVSGEAAGASGLGVYGYGGQYDFYAGGPGTNYGAFTGAHDVRFAEDMPADIVPGMIVSATGKAEARMKEGGGVSLSSTLPTVALTVKAEDKAVFGVLVSEGPLPKDHWFQGGQEGRYGVVNALGEGRMWVCDSNGPIEAGDYITSSAVPGRGQRQDDDLVHSYTVGKAIETLDWSSVTETVEFDGRRVKVYLLAVVYTSG